MASSRVPNLFPSFKECVVLEILSRRPRAWTLTAVPNTKRALSGLKKLGMIEHSTSEDGEEFWRMTPKGIRWIERLRDVYDFEV